MKDLTQYYKFIVKKPIIVDSFEQKDDFSKMKDLDRIDFIRGICLGNTISMDMFFIMAMFNFNKCSDEVSKNFF